MTPLTAPSIVQPPTGHSQGRPSEPARKSLQQPKEPQPSPSNRKTIPFHKLKRRKCNLPILDISILTSPIATLNVGSTPLTTFHIHQALLCSASPFFSRALNGRFREGTTKTVNLLDDDPRIVAAFVAWLYTGQVFGMFGMFGCGGPAWIDLCQLWIFGDRIAARRLQNEAMQLFLNSIRDKNGDAARFDFSNERHAQAIDEIYENTAPDSPLREAIVDAFMRQKGSKDLPSNMWLPKEFRQALATKEQTLSTTEWQIVHISGYLVDMDELEADEVLREHRRFWRGKREEELRSAVEGLKLTE